MVDNVLSHLSVRRAGNKERALERLEGQSADFVVCGVDGKPSFAFDVEQYHLSNAEARAERVREKNRILRTAGVRFVLLKNGIHRVVILHIDHQLVLLSCKVDLALCIKVGCGKERTLIKEIIFCT